MDKKVVRKMIKRLEAVPESYDQGVYFIEASSDAPCGTVACIAGEAVICSTRTVKAGIKLAFDNYSKIPEMARDLLGLPFNHCVFASDGSGWPAPYNDDFARAQSNKAKANVAVAYLKESLKRGAMVW